MTEPRASYRAAHIRAFDALVLLGVISRNDGASELECCLMLQLHEAGLLTRFEREVADIIPGRRFRFDFACRPLMIAVEVQGGTWVANTGHNSGRGLARDYEKSNLAQLLGWMVLHFDGEMVDDGRALSTIKAAIERGEGCAL